MATYRVLPGESFGVGDQFKAGDTLPAGYLTDEEAQAYLGWKLEVANWGEPILVNEDEPVLFVADAPVKKSK